MMRNRILIVDDENDILELLHYNLSKEGYEVTVAKDGAEAVQKAAAMPDLILLDVMMPRIDGFEVIRQLKQNSATRSIAVVFLTAKGMEIDEVVGFELGADDYIVKPVSMSRLLARIKKILRRKAADRLPTVDENLITVKGVSIDPRNHLVHVDGRETHFARKEFATLLFLARNRNRVVTRDELLTAVWGGEVVVVDRTIDVHIRKIREKIGRYADMLETVKGVGYRMRVER